MATRSRQPAGCLRDSTPMAGKATTTHAITSFLHRACSGIDRLKSAYRGSKEPRTETTCRDASSRPGKSSKVMSLDLSLSIKPNLQSIKRKIHIIAREPLSRPLIHRIAIAIMRSLYPAKVQKILAI